MRLERTLPLLAAAALLIGWLGTYTNVDLALARAMYDPAAATFPWRHAWLAEVFGHVYLKTLLACLGASVILPVFWDACRPIRRWRPSFRRRLRIVALAAILVPLVISLLKHASSSHCPWDLAMFGGTERYVRLLESVLPGVASGHCLPAGHASTALWLPAFAVFWLPHRPLRAAAVAALLFACGFALGWLQQLRGAHFLTHTLWSMWWAAAIITVLCALLLRPRRYAIPVWRASQLRKSAKGRAASGSLNIS